MKQRITIEQLNELTPEQKERLREWWKPEYGDSFIADYKYTVAWDKVKRHRHIMANVYNVKRNGDIEADGDAYDGHEVVKKQDCLPVLNVGQCIGLLKGVAPEKLCKIMVGLFSGRFIISEPDQTVDSVHCEPVETIDALWQAVKEVL